jgi:catechol 2,3-dioxygenase-like lactoylglutathione lyase family enzyme
VIGRRERQSFPSSCGCGIIHSVCFISKGRRQHEVDPMSLAKMEHFLVLTDDVDATRNFYRDILGMEEGFRPAMEFSGYWLYADGTACIHIGDRKTYAAYVDRVGLSISGPAPGTGPVDHIAFSAEDFEEVVARLKRHDKPFGQNSVPEIGLRQLFFMDPNGLKIEVNFMKRQ